MKKSLAIILISVAAFAAIPFAELNSRLPLAFRLFREQGKR